MVNMIELHYAFRNLIEKEVRRVSIFRSISIKVFLRYNKPKGGEET
jgi:hypothetical protein